MTNFQPIQLLEVELAQPLPDIAASNETTGQHYRHAMALVRLHTRPLGVVKFALSQQGLNASEYARQIWQALGAEITAHLREDGHPIAELTAAGLSSTPSPPCLQAREAALVEPPLVSIIIATRDRTAQLKLCIESLLALNYPNYEIVIVDSAPSDDATAKFVQQTYHDVARIRYVHAKQPGLALAHNVALPEIVGDIVAITDDDVQVDSYWLAEIVSAFKVAPNVGCVTGMILPAELETPTQLMIEEFGLSKGFKRRMFDLQDHRLPSPLFPYAAGTFGSGANMAFRTTVLREMNGFDPALGAGSVAMGGDDLASFFEVIMRGYTLVYEPAAFLRHWHRRDYPGLYRQAYGYGVSLGAYLTKILVDRPRLIFDVVRRAPAALAHLLSLRNPNSYPEGVEGLQPEIVVGDGDGERSPLIPYPPELRRRERMGMLAGPYRYLRSRWQSRSSPKGDIPSTFNPSSPKGDIPSTFKAESPRCAN